MIEEYRLHLQIRRVENGQHLATSDDLPGLATGSLSSRVDRGVAQGRTVAEAVEIARDVARKLIESYREHGDLMPKGLRAMNTEIVELDVPVGV